VIVSFIISLFPIVSNVTAGLISIDRNLLELFKLYHANRWQTLLRLRIPAAVSHLVLGARISSGMAVIGTIVGEFFVGNGGQYDGLGSVMTGWQSLQKTDALMAAIIVSTILGVAMFAIVNLISSTLLYRWTKSSGLDDAL
jgi:NitT/TauT family transport system permease protein